jgi:peptidyl-prolyl cis-trans isomerase SurA
MNKLKTPFDLSMAWRASARTLLMGLLVSLGCASVSALAQTNQTLDRVVAIVNAEAITSRELAQRVAVVSRQLQKQNIELPPPDILEKQVLDRLISNSAQMQLAKSVGVALDEAGLDRAVAAVAEQNKLSLSQMRDRVERDGVSWAQFRDDIRQEIVTSRIREREVDSRVFISESDIDAFLLEQDGSDLSQKEYNIAQILLRVSAGATAEQVTAQRLRGEEILKQVNKGVEFTRLAASFSDGPEAATGGSMGWRSADRIPQVFVDELISLKPGEVSKLIRSPNGFHILRLVDRRGAQLAANGPPVQQTRARHILLRVSEITPEADVLRRLTEIKQRVEAGTAKFDDLARQFSVDGSASKGGDLGWLYQGDTVPDFEKAMNQLKIAQISEPVRTQFGFHLIEVQERRSDEASPERRRSQARQALREQRSEEAYSEWLRQLRDRTFVEFRLEEK